VIKLENLKHPALQRLIDAAKAYGIQTYGFNQDGLLTDDGTWNPVADKEQCEALKEKLGICAWKEREQAVAVCLQRGRYSINYAVTLGDTELAYRLAITEAAAYGEHVKPAIQPVVDVTPPTTWNIGYELPPLGTRCAGLWDRTEWIEGEIVARVWSQQKGDQAILQHASGWFARSSPSDFKACTQHDKGRAVEAAVKMYREFDDPDKVNSAAIGFLFSDMFDKGMLLAPKEGGV
jgi:hypothetical protein